MDVLETQLAHHALQLVFLSVLLEQAGVPIPAMPVLVLCGTFAARGEIRVIPVLLAATLASLMADMVWFGLGGRRAMAGKRWPVSRTPSLAMRATCC
jgi:membrane protein DedA with SNARE-associated domain